jgi:hypothetical protein
MSTAISSDASLISGIVAKSMLVVAATVAKGCIGFFT